MSNKNCHPWTIISAIFLTTVSFLTAADPESPAIQRNVTNIQNGTFMNPYLPPLRLSEDGRIGVNQNKPGGSVQLVLIKPEKINETDKNFMQMPVSDTLKTSISTVNNGDQIEISVAGQTNVEWGATPVISDRQWWSHSVPTTYPRVDAVYISGDLFVDRSSSYYDPASSHYRNKPYTVTNSKIDFNMAEVDSGTPKPVRVLVSKAIHQTISAVNSSGSGTTITLTNGGLIPGVFDGDSVLISPTPNQGANINATIASNDANSITLTTVLSESLIAGTSTVEFKHVFEEGGNKDYTVRVNDLSGSFTYGLDIVPSGRLKNTETVSVDYDFRTRPGMLGEIANMSALCEDNRSASNVTRNPYSCSVSVLPDVAGDEFYGNRWNIEENASGDHDCYDLVIVQSGAYFEDANNNGKASTAINKLHSRAVTVAVKNPKTENATIAALELGEFRTDGGEPIGGGFLEPVITGDGKLLVVRIGQTHFPVNNESKSTCETQKENGEPSSGNCQAIDVVYSYNNELGAKNACDISGWNNFHPVSHAYYDDTVNTKYGFARYPLRAPDGTPITNNADARASYPWIDKTGSNLMMSIGGTRLTDDKNGGGVIDKFPASCIGGVSCRYPNGHIGTHEDKNNILWGTVVAGAWTQGKMIYIDNQINQVDFGMGVANNEHAQIDLYDNDGIKETRVGSGRVDSLEPGSIWPVGALHNTDFLESYENRFNYKKEFSAASFRDVVWKISDDTVTDEIAFDDYISNNAYIVSDMIAARTVNEPLIAGSERMEYWDGWDATTDQFKAGRARVQNAATTLAFSVPKYGQLTDYLPGDANNPRIEPVAMGGIKGRGLWLEESYGVSYAPVNPSQLSNKKDYFISLFVDARIQADNVSHRLVTFSDGSSIRLRRLPSSDPALPFTHIGFWQNNALLPVMERDVTDVLSSSISLQESWVQLGFQVKKTTGSPNHVTIYINGYEDFSWYSGVGPIFEMDQNSPIIIGATAASDGLKGWVDEFKVLFETPNLETVCNHAHGSLIGIDENSAVEWKSVADSFGVAGTGGHARISTFLKAYKKRNYSQYACFHDYSGDYKATANNVPRKSSGESYSIRSAMHMPEGPLYHDVPRPDSSNNDFCKSCHASTSPVPGLKNEALNLGSVPAAVDVRRQPSQPIPKIWGNIPNGWNGNVGHKHQSGDLYTSIDTLVMNAGAADSDNDGIPNANEHNSDPESADSDSDGLLDGWEIQNGLDAINADDAAGDLDNDGLSNQAEYAFGSFANDPDSDNDSLGDQAEQVWHSDPLVVDSDGDQLTDWEEVALYSTLPDVVDSDNDGMPDGWEIQNELDPTTNDTLLDFDVDGLSNLDEYLNGSFANNPDSDSDSLGDYAEFIWNSDPMVVDTDGDGLTDWQEVALHSSRPDMIDTDGDGWNDWDEVVVHETRPDLNDTDGDAVLDTLDAFPLDSLESVDTDGDNIGNNADPDDDGDYLGDGAESVHGTDPLVKDTDNDRLNDWNEVVAGTSPLNPMDPPRIALLADFYIGADNADYPATGSRLVAWLKHNGIFYTELAGPDSVIDMSEAQSDLCVLHSTGLDCLFDTHDVSISAGKKVVGNTTNGCVMSQTSIDCWGDDTYGQLTDMPVTANPVDIAVGLHHICVIDDTGVDCWGDNSFGQTDVPTLNAPTAIAAGDRHSCAVDGGSVICWGENTEGQKDVPPGLTGVLRISAGSYHTCVVAGNHLGVDTQVVCWGAGEISEPLAVRSANDEYQSVVPLNLVRPVDVRASGKRTCTIQAKSTSNVLESAMVCWPVNIDGDKNNTPDAGWPSDVISDSDMDLMPDWWEAIYHLDIGTDDASGNVDGDGLSNLREFNGDCFGNGSFINPIWGEGSNPLAGDTDDDGVVDDYDECRFSLNPRIQDTDSDGLKDGQEAYEPFNSFYQPQLQDTDNDSVLDGDEDCDGDGIVNILDPDPALTSSPWCVVP